MRRRESCPTTRTAARRFAWTPGRTSRTGTSVASARGSSSTRATYGPTCRTRLGPEPLVQSFSASRLALLAEGRRAPVKAFLLDQRRIAGIGNIYADEALWRARIHPRRPAGELDEVELARLHRAVRAALRKGVELQGSTLREYTTPDGTPGRMQREFHVYGREGEPCDRCGRPIDRTVVGGRGTWFCPHCQRETTRLKHVPARSYTRRVAAYDDHRGRRPPLVRVRRGRPRPPPLHGGSGRLGAVAKGVRRTKSRFGGRLEPFSHVELGLHRGRGELATVTGASLVRSHDRIRSDGYRLQVGLVGLEAMLKLYTEEEQNDRAFLALTRFLDALDEREPQRGNGPRSTRSCSRSSSSCSGSPASCRTSETCVECGSGDELVAFMPSAGGAVCAACDRGGIGLSPEGRTSRARAPRRRRSRTRSGLDIRDRAARDVLAVVTSSYEHHGGFRLRTLSA